MWSSETGGVGRTAISYSRFRRREVGTIPPGNKLWQVARDRHERCERNLQTGQVQKRKHKHGKFLSWCCPSRFSHLCCCHGNCFIISDFLRCTLNSRMQYLNNAVISSWIAQLQILRTSLFLVFLQWFFSILLLCLRGIAYNWIWSMFCF